jgi:hypothetical protein
MTDQTRRGLADGRRAYEQRGAARRPAPRPVITDAEKLRTADRAELGRTRLAAEHGDTAAQAALRDFDHDRDLANRGRYRATSELDDETLAAISRMTLADVESRRAKTVTPPDDAA